ncbi:MAG: hypothetical protein H0W28_10115, partial [Pyrinomonadaceae bacterium]|nr:hypothetical protein [Pyrinomonadaceae bacterium]
ILSDQQDKLLYAEMDAHEIYVLNLVNNETLIIDEGCDGYAWIDNNTVVCGWPQILIDAQDGSKLNTKVINYQENPIELIDVVTNNHEVYELAISGNERRVFILLAQEPAQQSYYIFLVPEDVELPENVQITVIPANRELPIDRVSPNGEYYFRESEDEWLRIYDKNDRLISQVSFDETTNVIGWAYDSSGVLFLRRAGFLDPRKFPIQKLTVR